MTDNHIPSPEELMKSRPKLESSYAPHIQEWLTNVQKAASEALRNHIGVLADGESFVFQCPDSEAQAQMMWQIHHGKLVQELRVLGYNAVVTGPENFPAIQISL